MNYARIARPLKRVEWLGSSKKDLKNFPDEVQDEIGRALMRAQFGAKDIAAKPWRGLGTGVMEIVSRFDTNAYRAVYAVNLSDKIYVLHTFQKKSKRGIGTPKEEVELIRARYKQAVEMSKEEL